MLLLAIAAGVAQLTLGIHPNAADFAMLVIVYTAASNGARWASRLALVGALSAAALSEWRWPDSYNTGWTRVVQAVFLTIPFALAWVIGDSLRTRRAYYAQL